MLSTRSLTTDVTSPSSSRRMPPSPLITACSSVSTTRPVQPSMSASMAQDVSCYRRHQPVRTQIMFRVRCSSPSQNVMAYLHGWPSNLRIPAGSGSQLMTLSVNRAWFIWLMGMLIALLVVCYTVASTFLAGGEMMWGDSALSTRLLTQWSNVYLLENSSRSLEQPTTYGLILHLGMICRITPSWEGMDMMLHRCTSSRLCFLYLQYWLDITTPSPKHPS